MATTDLSQTDPGAVGLSQTQPPAGLINTAPGMTNTTPGATTGGVGAPVTSYTPSNAEAVAAQPKAYGVDPNATVAGQIKGLIDAGSPLLQQAETAAAQKANQRGLINSSQAITAGQAAVYQAALPIAQQDAQTYDKAATNTTNAENQAELQNSQLGTQTSQFNSGQDNAAFAKAADASNQQALQNLQTQGNIASIQTQGNINLQLQAMQDRNKLLLQSSQGASQLYQQMVQYMGVISSNKDMGYQQKTVALNNVVQTVNEALQTMSSLDQTIPDLRSLLYFTNGG